MRTVTEGTTELTVRGFTKFYLRYCRTYNGARTLEMKRIYLRRILRAFGGQLLADLGRLDVECYIQRRKAAGRLPDFSTKRPARAARPSAGDELRN